MRIFFAAFFVVGALVAPAVGFAHAPDVFPLGYWGGGERGLLSCTGDYVSGTEKCDDLCDLVDTFTHFIYFGMSLLLFAIAPVLLAWGGIKIVIAGASPEGIEAGKKILTGTLIAIGIALLGFLLIDQILKVLVEEGPGKGGLGVLTCPNFYKLPPELLTAPR